MAEGGQGDGGDGPVLSKLRELSAGLCEVAVGNSSNHTASTRVEVETLLRVREQLKQQKFDLQTRIGAGEITIDELALEYITEEHLEEAIKQLVLEIENAKVAYYNKSLLLQRMQVFYRIQNKLLEKNADSELFREMMSHSLSHATLILQEQKKTRTMEKQLVKLREERMALKEKSTELMTELLSTVEELRFQKEPKEQKLKKLYTFIKKETDAAVMLQNIFQRLVHASRVNWVADPKLREAVMKAGKDLDSF